MKYFLAFLFLFTNHMTWAGEIPKSENMVERLNRFLPEESKIKINDGLDNLWIGLEKIDFSKGSAPAELMKLSSQNFSSCSVWTSGNPLYKSSKSSPVAEKMIVQMVKDKNIEGLNKLGKLFLTLSKCEAPNTEKTPALLLVIKIIEKLRDLGEKTSWFQPLNPTEMKISGLKGDYSVAGALNFIDLEVGYEKKLLIALKNTGVPKSKHKSAVKLIRDRNFRSQVSMDKALSLLKYFDSQSLDKLPEARTLLINDLRKTLSSVESTPEQIAEASLLESFLQLMPDLSTYGKFYDGANQKINDLLK